MKNNTITFSESCALTSGLYEHMIEIPAENAVIFERDRNVNLNALERIAMENVACDFILAYEAEAYGLEEGTRRAELMQYIRVKSDGADILDGCYDTYEFDGFLICEFWATNNGCIMLTAFRIPEEYQGGEWMDQDWMSDFEQVLFRLN